jgi:hypothetical protein
VAVLIVNAKATWEAFGRLLLSAMRAFSVRASAESWTGALPVEAAAVVSPIDGPPVALPAEELPAEELG